MEILSKKLLCGFLMVGLLLGCGRDDDNFNPNQFEDDVALIETYLAENNITATEDPTGIFYTVDREGFGEKPAPSAYVFSRYKGFFLDGTVFDETPTGDTSILKLDQLIPGLRIGMALMKEGGQSTFYLPSGLAYGRFGSSSGAVGPNTVTAFEIEMFDNTDQSGFEDFLITEYIKDNQVEDVVADSSGIYYTIETPGTGGSPTSTSKVTVKYKGYLLDGTVFDQTEGDATAEFSLGGLIPGWRIAIPKLQKGGKGTFFLPSTQGYGNQVTGNIPANSVLIFDIELIDFE